jgi:hypothetical protein
MCFVVNVLNVFFIFLLRICALQFLTLLLLLQQNKMAMLEETNAIQEEALDELNKHNTDNQAQHDATCKSFRFCVFFCFFPLFIDLLTDKVQPLSRCSLGART